MIWGENTVFLETPHIPEKIKNWEEKKNHQNSHEIMFQQVFFGSFVGGFLGPKLLCQNPIRSIECRKPPDESPQALAALAEQGELNLEDLSEEEVGWVCSVVKPGIRQVLFGVSCVFLVNCVLLRMKKELKFLFVCVNILGIFEILDLLLV